MVDLVWVVCLVVGLIIFFTGGIFFQNSDMGTVLILVGFVLIMIASVMVMTAIVESAPDEVIKLYANGTAVLGNGTVVDLLD